jgi:hypothetical protein
MSTDRNPLSDKELWQRIAPATGRAPVAVSDNDFAAWLEGGLPEAEAARIEAAVTSDPILRQSAIDLADILGKPLPVAPARMAVRAQALVGFEAERGVRGTGWFARLFTFGAPMGITRAAFATLALFIAVSGFMLGGGLGESYAQEKYVVASNQTAVDSNNELTAFFAPDGI